jgi:hypothetical protein
MLLRNGDLMSQTTSHQAALTFLLNEHVSRRGLRVKVWGKWSFIAETIAPKPKSYDVRLIDSGPIKRSSTKTSLHNEVGPGGAPCAPPYVRRVRIYTHGTF